MRTLRVLVLLFILPWPTCLIADDAEHVYHNPTLGITVTKPEKWHFVTATEVAKNLERIRLSDEDFDTLLKTHATAPIVAMTKYKEPFDDLNPSLKVNIKPLRGFLEAEPVRILQTVSAPLTKAFPDLKFVTKPKETKLAGLNAAYMCIDYSLTTPDGRKFPTRSELWVVPRGKMFFMIGIGSRQDEKTGTRKELHTVIESIKIAPERTNVAPAIAPEGPSTAGSPEVTATGVPNPRFGNDTPEAAIRSFYTALANGDGDTARHLLVEPKKMRDWIEVQVKMSNAFRHFSEAAASHFGDEGKPLQLPVPAEMALKKLDDIKPTQNGDNAEWRTNPALPTKLVRSNGHWKLDLYASFMKSEQIEQQNAAFRKVASYVERIAVDMEKGRYKSIAEVRAELKLQRDKANGGN